MLIGRDIVEKVSVGFGVGSEKTFGRSSLGSDCRKALLKLKSFQRTQRLIEILRDKQFSICTDQARVRLQKRFGSSLDKVSGNFYIGFKLNSKKNDPAGISGLRI